MRVIIAGSRHITNKELLEKAIKDSGFEIEEVVSGMASGVDKLGEEWAVENGKPIKYFPADWDGYGKSAGPARNKKMSEYADALIAIWDSKSTGTKNMIDHMYRKRKPVYILKV